MNYRATSIAALGLVLGLASCGDRQADSAADTGAPVEAAPMVPAPSPGAEHETALIEMQAELGTAGLKVALSSADFDSGTSKFAPQSTDRIDHVAGLLKERPDLRVVITGYTDDRGSDAANMRLSQRRSDSVRDFLVAQGGVDGSRIESKGMGEAEPVASNDTEEGRAQNRRVELRIVDAGGGYTSLASN
jgi:OmpA-OmpF porin, OOP family